MNQPLTWPEFEKIEIRTGTILEVKEFARAKKPAYQLIIDFGEFGVKQSSAQITNYHPADLIGTQVIAVLNFAPKNIAGFMSEYLVLGIYNENSDVILLQPRSTVKNGCRVG